MPFRYAIIKTFELVVGHLDRTTRRRSTPTMSKLLKRPNRVANRT